VRARASFVVAAVLASGLASAETEVRVAGDKVDVRATTAPLSDVLDRLSKALGMKVVYDGPPPRGRVTMALAGLSAPRMVMAILEGQGLNFLLKLDPSGQRVDTLMIVSSGGSVGSAPGSPPAVPRPDGPRLFQRDRSPDPEPEVEEEPPAAEAPSAEELEKRLPGTLPPTGPAMPLTFPPPVTLPAQPALPPGVPPSPAPVKPELQ
jgi:hypothetical protein